MNTRQQDESPLFLMRLWGEDGDAAAVGAAPDGVVRSKWHGKLLHVATGETLYFTGWPALLSLLRSMFPDEMDSESQPAPLASAED
jgi:hypothetical protein